MMDRFDFLGLIGLGALGVGLWMYSPALALTVVGALIIAAAVFGARAARRAGTEDGE